LAARERVPENRIRWRSCLKAEVDAVELELDADHADVV